MAVTFNSNMTDAQANSYVSVEEADEYFSNHKSESDWTALATADKQKALIRATADLDSFRYQGHKYRVNQALEFPRVARRDNVALFHSGRLSLALKWHKFIATPSTVTDASTLEFQELVESNEIPYYPENFWKDGQVLVLSGGGRFETSRIAGSSSVNGEITLESALATLPDTSTRILIMGPMAPNIRAATCEQALYRSTDDSDQGSSRATLIAQGVKSIKTGNASESYKGSGGSVLIGEAYALIVDMIQRTARIT